MTLTVSPSGLASDSPESVRAAPPTPPPAQKREHVPALDGIRGLAILMVMAHHLFVLEKTGVPIVDWLLRLLEKGWSGVDLFFVLSGFLITTILLESKNQPHYFRNFYMRRTLRIFPLYYFCVVGGLLILPAITQSIAGVSTISEQSPAWFLFYGANFLVTKNQSWTAGSPFLHMGQFWSLAVEEHFYLIWPLIIYLTPRRILPHLCGAMIAAVLVARASWFLRTHDLIGTYTLTWFRMDTLCWGAMLAMLFAAQRGRQLLSRFGKPVFITSGIALFIALCFTAFDRGYRFVPVAGYSLLAVFFSALIYVTITPGPRNICRTMFSAPCLRFFGKYSYGIYVYHFIFLGMFESLNLDSRFGNIFHSHPASHFATKFSATVVSLGVAMLSWRFFEKPILRLKNHFP